MNPATSAPPLPHLDAQHVSRPMLPLDTRIAAVEQRLLAREIALTQGVHTLMQRVRGAPRRLLGPAAGGGVALLVMWWLLRGRAPRAAVASRVEQSMRAEAVPTHGSGEMPWVHLLALAWPLLPRAWRARVSPATAATVISIGLPLAERLLAPRTHPPLPTVAHLDLARYAGTWFEIARLPASFETVCEGQPQAHYALDGDAVRVRNTCRRGDGREQVADGVARVVPGSGHSKLEVNFLPRWLHWLPFGWADYWVLHVDADYRVALVGHPNRRYLWVLARTPRIDDATWQDLVERAAPLGFPVDRLLIAQPPGP